MAAVRLVSAKRSADAATELRINSSINWLFRQIMSIEFSLNRFGINFPFGGSRLLIAMKQSV